MDLSKKEELDVDPKPIQQINFKGNPARNPIANTTTFLIIKEAKETILEVSKGTVKE